VTYFGESDRKRYNRLIKCLENKEEVVSSKVQGNFFNQIANMTEEDFKKL